MNYQIFVIGGMTAYEGILRYNEYFDHNNDKWTKKNPMLTNRFGHIAINFNNRAYLIGGSQTRDGKTLKTNEMFVP